MFSYNRPSIPRDAHTGGVPTIVPLVHVSIATPLIITNDGSHVYVMVAVSRIKAGGPAGADVASTTTGGAQAPTVCCL